MHLVHLEHHYRLAVDKKNEAMVQMLIAKGVDIHRGDLDHDPPLELWTEGDAIYMMLLEKEAELEQFA